MNLMERINDARHTFFNFEAIEMNIYEFDQTK